MVEIKRIDGKDRFYQVGDEKYPSVTTILKLLDKSGPLTQWAANMTVEWIRQNSTPIDFKYYDPQKEDLRPFRWEISEDQLNEARFNFRTISQEALSVGGEAHSMIERWLRDPWPGAEDVVSTEAFRAFSAFQCWYKENEIEPIYIEQTVYSTKHRYAGTLDLLCWGKIFKHINKKLLWLIDFKTSKSHYVLENAMQLDSYRIAVNEMKTKHGTRFQVAPES
jgi:hypothetical protein